MKLNKTKKMIKNKSLKKKKFLKNDNLKTKKNKNKIKGGKKQISIKYRDKINNETILSLLKKNNDD